MASKVVRIYITVKKLNDILQPVIVILYPRPSIVVLLFSQSIS